MDCVTKSKDGAEILLEFCSGSLDAARAAHIERHIEACQECRRVVEAQRETWAALDAWRAPAVSHNFNARLYARMTQDDSQPLWRRWARRIFQPPIPVPMWKPAVSLAAACAVLAVALAVRTPEPVAGTGKQVRAEHVRAENVDIEQVANTLDDLEMLSPASPM